MGSCDNGVELKKTVLVTGFGPFGIHQVNASWSAVQQLSQLGVTDDVELIVQEIPVEYDNVLTMVPKLWKEHKPQLVVHVGVSGIATELTLEQQAHNDGYHKEDVKQQCPNNRCCVIGSDNCIQSGINMEKVCEDVNTAGLPTRAVISFDPGRYLCDFCFYTSLHIDRHRSAFIHVPPLGKPYSALDLATGIRQAIISMLKQVPC